MIKDFITVSMTVTLFGIIAYLSSFSENSKKKQYFQSSPYNSIESFTWRSVEKS